jgi:hypothetical protein
MLFGCVFAAFAHAGTWAQAEVQITVDPVRRTAVVKGKLEASGGHEKNLSFLPSAIGIPDLGRRSSGVLLTDNDGKRIGYKAFNSAEYVAERSFSAFEYAVDLSPAADARSAAHASWVSGDAGLIYLDDLLPLGVKKAAVSFQLPRGWVTRSSEPSAGKNVFEVNDTGRAVFVIGNAIRSAPGSSSGPAVAVSGNWLFTDVEAAEMAAEILEEYRKIFGALPSGSASVVLLPMPQEAVSKGTWEAETRGTTVVIASTDMPFRTQSLQRLHEQLRHELFHLWLPNAVKLTGKYDWFYEGFALYQSLKTGVALNRIRFEDMLDTLSRAHNIDKSEIARRSLLEASDDRWAGAETVVYARGMLVAFLADLELLRASGGKRSVETIFRNVLASSKSLTSAADGNTVILKAFNEDTATAAIARDHISGSKPINWDALIESAGLESEPGTSRTKLRIRSKLNGGQKAMLDKLGYNNWRKLRQK